MSLPLPLKLNLFHRITELAQLATELKKISRWPVLKRKQWLKQNGPELQKLLVDYTKTLEFEFDQDEHDAELLKLVMEFTANLQHFSQLVQHLYPDSVNVLQLSQVNKSRKM